MACVERYSTHTANFLRTMDREGIMKTARTDLGIEFMRVYLYRFRARISDWFVQEACALNFRTTLVDR